VVDRNMPRVQEVILPILRSELASHWSTLDVTSWIKDVDAGRTFPMLNIRRVGGQAVDPRLLDRAVIEMTAYTRDGIVETEDLYLDARHVLWDMVRRQTVIPEVGHLHSFFEVMGMTQFDSPFDGTWRVQGLIQLAVRPPRN
jgi:hypothetical protein